MDSGLGMWWRAGDVLQAAQYILESFWSLCLDIPAVIGKSWSCLVYSKIQWKCRKLYTEIYTGKPCPWSWTLARGPVIVWLVQKRPWKKSANCLYNPSHSQWLPKVETPAWREALLVLDEAFKQHSHTWLWSFIRSTTGSFKKSKIQ